MLIRYAIQSDTSSWINLAEDVAPIFRAPNMASDPDFIEYMKSKISKNEALIAIDMATSSCMGIIGFSRTHNRITWFGVFTMHRSKGVGSKLLRTALDELDRTKEITVETYREDYEAGRAARAVYKKFGFVDKDDTLTDKLGNPICLMVLAPPDDSKFSILEPIEFNNRSFFPMKFLAEIHHGDLGLTLDQSGGQSYETAYKVRKTVRTVLLDPFGKVALLHLVNDGFYKLPGGGLDDDEDVVLALKRIVRDKVGVEIEVLKPIGIILEYRTYFQQLQFSYAFISHVTGTIKRPDDSEIIWTSLDQAIELVSGYSGKLYMPRFTALRDGKILREAKKDWKANRFDID